MKLHTGGYVMARRKGGRRKTRMSALWLVIPVMLAGVALAFWQGGYLPRLGSTLTMNKRSRFYKAPIFMPDARGETLAEVHYIHLNPDWSPEQGLGLLCRELSREFGGLPVVPVHVRKEQGDLIAVIDLRESTSNRGRRAEDMTGPNWCGGYLQGSTGGGMTSSALKETILQREYKGPWISGARFSYEGKSFSEQDFIHTDLSGTFRR